VFRLKKNAVDLANDKVEKMLAAKMNNCQPKLSGRKEAYAANILRLVATELNLPIKMVHI
jgi:hypothetical protein